MSISRVLGYESRLSWLLAGLLLLAANLRGPVTAVGPVLASVQANFGLSPAEAGLLTTLPLLAFALISPLAGGIARAWGMERTLFVAMLALAAGILLRSSGLLTGLYGGTVLAGVAIALGNVLMPAVVKRDFSAHVAVVTSACALTMGVTAALASSAAVPVAGYVGWQGALGLLAILPLTAALLWRTQMPPASAQAVQAAAAGPVWRHALAWQLTLFMGLNSLLYYAVVTWLPAILAAAGYSAASAGALHGVMQLASAVPGLLLAPLVARSKDQRWLAAAAGLLMIVGLAGLCYLPALASVWVICFGAGSGAGLILALMFMSLRAATPRQAASLSGMAQCLGYLLAACGPLLAGQAHEWGQGWSLPLLAGLALALVMAAAGALAGRARVLHD